MQSSTPSESLITGIAFRGIQADAYLTVRIVRRLESLGELGTTIAHVLTPWWSMYMHEGRTVLEQRLPELISPVPPEAAEVFAHARHSVKMFQDTKRSVDAYEQYFAEIGRTHSQHFVASVPLPFRGLSRDLGVTTCDGQVVMTTHGAAFATGMEPSMILDPDLGARFQNHWRFAGQYAAMAALATDGPRPMVMDAWGGLTMRTRDHRSSDYYASTFMGRSFERLNAVLLHYLGVANAINLLLPIEQDLESDEYSLTKIRFLACHHILASLVHLRESGRELPRMSIEHLSDLINDLPEPRLAKLGRLRNLFVHYKPHSKADLGAFDRERLLNGVLKVSSSEIGPDELIDSTNRNLHHLVSGLNRWSGTATS